MNLEFQILNLIIKMDQLRIKVGQIQLVTYHQPIFTILPETSDSISLNNLLLQHIKRLLYQ
jgi:hypothetical protein